MKRKLSSLCLVAAIAASLSTMGCKPNANSNGNNNGGGGEAVDRLFIGLRLAVAGSGPLLALLVRQGKLSKEKADFIRDDFADVVDVVDKLKDEVRAATDTAGRLAAAQKAYREFKLIYERGHFGASPEILLAANLGNSIFIAIVELYGGTVFSAPRVAPPQTEQAQRAAIEAKIEELKQALAVK